MSEHEDFQPRPQSTKRHPNSYKPCPTCNGLMAKHAIQCRRCRETRPKVTHPSDPSKRSIPLTQGQVATVDADEFERVNQWPWFASKSETGKFYAVRNEFRDGKWVRVSMHRFVLGVTDSAIEVDHKNPLDTLNNTRANLRIANSSLNGANRLYRANSSGYKGVTLLPQKPGRRKSDRWRGQIYVNRKSIISPIYRDPIPAAKWYDTMARKYFGEFAQCNFPEDHNS